jgi:hypothetical protein
MGSLVIANHATSVCVNPRDQPEPHNMAAPIQETETNRFDKWWKDLGVRKLLAWQATILVSQMTTGYDESVVGSFQSMKPWVKGL